MATIDLYDGSYFSEIENFLLDSKLLKSVVLQRGLFPGSRKFTKKCTKGPFIYYVIRISSRNDALLQLSSRRDSAFLT